MKGLAGRQPTPTHRQRLFDQNSQGVFVCVWSPLKRSHFVLSPAYTTQTSLFEATTHSLQRLNEQRRLENLRPKKRKKPRNHTAGGQFCVFLFFL